MLKVFSLTVAVLILGALVQTNDGASAQISSLSLADLNTLLATPGKGDQSTQANQQQQCGCNNEIKQLEQKMNKLEKVVNGPHGSGGSSAGGGSVVIGNQIGLPASCRQIKAADPLSTSGYYDIYNDGRSVEVYCKMEKICGEEGGWTRMAYLDMTDPQADCPAGLKYYNENGIRVCARKSAGCQSVKFPSHDVSYTQVCGRVTGYQHGTPDGIHSGLTIDQVYVDGVSLTRGDPRNHIWTFMAAIQENSYYGSGDHNCPCTPNPQPTTPKLPQFIRDHYYCESGCPSSWKADELYTGDPLWDGKQCGSVETDCCNAPGIPWFHRVIAQPTTDFIEMRLCADEGTANEEITVGSYEVYVK